MIPLVDRPIRWFQWCAAPVCDGCGETVFNGTVFEFGDPPYQSVVGPRCEKCAIRLLSIHPIPRAKKKLTTPVVVPRGVYGVTTMEGRPATSGGSWWAGAS